VPLAVLLNAIAVIVEPEQMLCDVVLAVAVTLGFTSTVAVMGVPVQELTVGVIVNVTVTGAALVLVKGPLIVPVPLAAIPVMVAVLSLVQL
jgi:hypothetical protein